MEENQIIGLTTAASIWLARRFVGHPQGAPQAAG